MSGEPFDPEWAFDDNAADGKLIVTVFTWTPQGDVRTEIALPYEQAVTFANAILSEVEIAQQPKDERRLADQCPRCHRIGDQTVIGINIYRCGWCTEAWTDD